MSAAFVIFYYTLYRSTCLRSKHTVAFLADVRPNAYVPLRKRARNSVSLNMHGAIIAGTFPGSSCGKKWKEYCT